MLLQGTNVQGFHEAKPSGKKNDCAADEIKLIKINNYQLNLSSMCDVQIPSNYMHLNERRTKYDTRVEGHPR